MYLVGHAHRLISVESSKQYNMSFCSSSITVLKRRIHYMIVRLYEDTYIIQTYKQRWLRIEVL